jgi:hypothetical protein
VVARVSAQVPELTASSLAVVDYGGDLVKQHYGSASPILAAFQAVGDEDLWMNPPTWVYTSSDDEHFFDIQPWLLDQLPPKFLALLRQAGMDV